MNGEIFQGERRRWLVGTVVVLGLATVETDRTSGVLSSILSFVAGLAGGLSPGWSRSSASTAVAATGSSLANGDSSEP